MTEDTNSVYFEATLLQVFLTAAKTTEKDVLLCNIHPMG